MPNLEDLFLVTRLLNKVAWSLNPLTGNRDNITPVMEGSLFVTLADLVFNEGQLELSSEEGWQVLLMVHSE